MRLIDIDRLCNDLVKRWSIADKEKEDLIRAVMADVVTPIVASQPTVDAVEVVRCKECMHYGVTDNRIPEEQVWWCYFWDDVKSPDAYCSDGERKGGDEHEVD